MINMEKFQWNFEILEIVGFAITLTYFAIASIGEEKNLLLLWINDLWVLSTWCYNVKNVVKEFQYNEEVF